MSDLFITYLQIFGIGLSFGIIGPCFLSCAPALVTYIVGSKKAWREALNDIFIFLCGRLIAYLILGFLAGLSAKLLRNFVSSDASSYFKPLAGAVTIFFAFIVLLKKDSYECECPKPSGRVFNLGGVLIFGLVIGLSPCAPLLALLFDIALMSKNALDGIFYALSFGLGTFLSGLITVGAIGGLLTRIPATLIKSRSVNTVFKIICALLLVVLGLGLILR